MNEQYVRGLSGKFADIANKRHIVYNRLMKVYINKYQLSGAMHIQYDQNVFHSNFIIHT